MKMHWNPSTLSDRIAIEQLAMSLYAEVKPVEKNKTKPRWGELGTKLRQHFRNNAQILLNESLEVIDMTTGAPKDFPDIPDLPSGWSITPAGHLLVPEDVEDLTTYPRSVIDAFRTIRRKDGVFLKTPIVNATDEDGDANNRQN